MHTFQARPKKAWMFYLLDIDSKSQVLPIDKSHHITLDDILLFVTSQDHYNRILCLCSLN